MVLALNNGSVAGTFNIGSGLPTTINDLARLLRASNPFTERLDPATQTYA
ncbi:MAG: hypothetical protein QXU47_05880 [Candidatus Bathyarchaeia archaeon]